MRRRTKTKIWDRGLSSVERFLCHDGVAQLYFYGVHTNSEEHVATRDPPSRTWTVGNRSIVIIRVLYIAVRGMGDGKPGLTSACNVVRGI